MKGKKSKGGSNENKAMTRGWRLWGLGFAPLSASCSFFLQLGSCFLKYPISTVNNYHIWNILPDILGSANISTCLTFCLTGDGRVTAEGASGSFTLKRSRNTLCTPSLCFSASVYPKLMRGDPKGFHCNSLVCYTSQFAATSKENVLLCTAQGSMPYKDMCLSSTDDYSDSAGITVWIKMLPLGKTKCFSAAAFSVKPSISVFGAYS